MLRRQAVSLLLGAAAARGSIVPTPLDRFFDTENGSALLIDTQAGRVIALHNGAVAKGYVAPPGSTLKPLVLSALLRSHKLRDDEAIPCPGLLTIAGRQFNCSHPHLDFPMQPHTALAYSCNYFVARVAERFAPGELARELESAGLHGERRITRAAGADAIRLQALGEEGVAVSLEALVYGYRRMAMGIQTPVLTGLEEAVEFGTAQRAQTPAVKVAGKTGSSRTSDGAALAWFAGFAPSRDPQVAIGVMLQGKSGGSDAAPIAGRILDAWRRGKL